MSDNVKDFIIFCTNTEGEVVKLHIKNMPDADERIKFFSFGKKINQLLNIFFVLLLVL